MINKEKRSLTLLITVRLYMKFAKNAITIAFQEILEI